MIKICLILCCLFLLVIIAGAFSQDIFKAEMEFCHSCHVGNKPLHNEIYKTQIEKPPVTLGGKHYLEKKISCVECHKGIEFKEKVSLFLIKSFNVFKYLSGFYEEPSALSYPMADSNCVRCHKGMEKINSNGFHGKNAHIGMTKVSCIECHRVHEKVNEPGEYFFVKSKMLVVCSGCHPGLSNKIKGLLVSR